MQIDEYKESILIDEKKLFHRIEQKVFIRQITFIVFSFFMLSVGYILLVVQLDINYYIKIWSIVGTILVYNVCMRKFKRLLEWKF
jgi:hypothetical protein